jgi:hypothetical protein
VKKFAIASFAKLGKCYGLSRQGVHYLSRQHDTAILDPEQLFQNLVSSGRQSKLRTMLSDPGERQRIAKQISKS